MKNQHFLRNWTILIIILLLIFFWGKSYWNNLGEPVDPKGQEQAIVVKKGDTLSGLADQLKSKGLIRSVTRFKWALRQNPNFNDLVPGDYKLSPSMSTDQIIQVLAGGPADRWVTLLEGWRVEEMADELNSKLKLDKSKFLAVAKEGYMFPDTYLFNQDATAETITVTLRNTFNAKYSADLQAKVRALGLTPDQGVILASIVEREARTDLVRTQVASILLKRLKIGMALNVDSTVRYAKDSQALKSGQTVKFWQAIDQSDYTDVKSPYNTYLYPGLPPGPICNPSSSSLTAVANANPNTSYLYYYHDSKGNSYYATTLDEHNANVANHP